MVSKFGPEDPGASSWYKSGQFDTKINNVGYLFVEITIFSKVDDL
jgi:hypothetical protein